MCRGHRIPQRRPRPRRREVTDGPVDPVADQLHPAIAALRLLPYVRDQLVRLDLVRETPDVAPRARDVPPAPYDPRQIGTLVDPVRVVHRTAIARSEEHTSELQPRGQLVCRL